jgi:hypothetical protein
MAAPHQLTELPGTSRKNGTLPDLRPSQMAPEDVYRWRQSVKHIQDCHYEAAASLRWYHYATGIPLVVLSVIAGSNLVSEAKLLEGFGPYVTLITSALSVMVTVLAAVQTFLEYEKRSELHYKAGAKYGAIKREIELHKNMQDAQWLTAVSTQWNTLTEESPIIPLRIWHRHEKKRQQADQDDSPIHPLRPEPDLASA